MSYMSPHSDCVSPHSAYSGAGAIYDITTASTVL